MHWYIRPVSAIAIAMGLSGVLLGQTSEPPATPFLRIETGMHTARVNRIAADAAERFLVTASFDKSVRVWDLSSGQLLQVLRPPQGDSSDGQVNAVAISPDATTVAVGGYGFAHQPNSIYLFERPTGKLLSRIIEGSVAINHLAYSSDGRFLAASLWSGGIRVYRTSDNQEIARDTDYGAESYSVHFDRGGRLVATCYDGAVRLYDADFRLVSKRQAPGGKKPFSARFSPDGSKVAVGFDDSPTVDVVSGMDLTFLYAADTSRFKGDYSVFYSVVWSADGQFLYAAGRYGNDDGMPVLRFSDSGRGGAIVWPTALDTIMDLLPLSGGRLLFGSQDPAIGMLDSTGRRVWQHTPDVLDHRSNLNKLKLSRDGSVVDFGFDVRSPEGTWNRRIGRFSLAERKLQIDPPPDSSLAPPRITGLNILNWEDSDKATLNGRTLISGVGEESRSLAISANADTFLLGMDFSLRLFGRNGDERWQTPMPAEAWVVNLTQDRRYGVAGLGDGTLRWYALEDGKEVLALFVHPDGKRWVAWTPEGFFDASPGGDALIGYHLNQGADRAGEFIRVDQVFNLFYRSDLVAGRLKAGGAEAVRAARDRIGDVASIIKGGLPPQLAMVSPAESQSQGDFLFQFRVTDAGGGIGRVVYRIDGVEIEGRDAGPILPGQGVQNRRFSLSPGAHEVSATVYNGKNQLESRSVTAKVNVTASEQPPSLFIVAAGVTHYRDHSFDEGVKFASADAGAFVSRLQAQGRGLFANVNPYPLLDDQVTRDNIEKTVENVVSRIQPSDVFVLYLAGHGTAIDGQYYFIPWEVRYTSEAALKQQSMDEEAIRKLLARIPAKKTLIILDTCNSGAFSSGRGPGDKAAVDRLAKITGRAILEASASDKMALEGYQDHSVLMAAMLEALSKVADSNGQVQLTRFADYVVDRVPSITKERWHYEQFPMWLFEGQTFPIALKPPL
jgi:WD40 repeat protein